MKNANRLMCLVGTIAMLAFASNAEAQNCATGNCGGSCKTANCGPRPGQPCPQAAPSNDCIGDVGPNGRRYLNPAQTLILASRDNYSPQPLYAYGPAGLDATRMDYWNRNTAAPQNSWHGGYNYWRYGQPMALVVPPTASFQTEYNWGVGQTRSIPIYHQYSGNTGVGGAAAGQAGAFRNTPYWPNSTSQFGVYPVRSPW